MPKLTPRSKVIRSLNLFVSWFEATGIPKSRECAACEEVTKVIERLLDDALNHEDCQVEARGNRPERRPRDSEQSDAAGNIYDHQIQDREASPPHLLSRTCGDDDMLTGNETSEEFLTWLDGVDWNSIPLELDYGFEINI